MTSKVTFLVDITLCDFAHHGNTSGGRRASEEGDMGVHEPQPHLKRKRPDSEREEEEEVHNSGDDNDERLHMLDSPREGAAGFEEPLSSSSRFPQCETRDHVLKIRGAVCRVLAALQHRWKKVEWGYTLFDSTQKPKFDASTQRAVMSAKELASFQSFCAALDIAASGVVQSHNSSNNLSANSGQSGCAFDDTAEPLLLPLKQRNASFVGQTIRTIFSGMFPNVLDDGVSNFVFVLSAGPRDDIELRDYVSANQEVDSAKLKKILASALRLKQLGEQFKKNKIRLNWVDTREAVEWGPVRLKRRSTKVPDGDSAILGRLAMAKVVQYLGGSILPLEHILLCHSHLSSSAIILNSLDESGSTSTRISKRYECWRGSLVFANQAETPPTRIELIPALQKNSQVKEESIESSLLFAEDTADVSGEGISLDDDISSIEKQHTMDESLTSVLTTSIIDENTCGFVLDEMDTSMNDRSTIIDEDTRNSILFSQLHQPQLCAQDSTLSSLKTDLAIVHSFVPPENNRSHCIDFAPIEDDGVFWVVEGTDVKSNGAFDSLMSILIRKGICLQIEIESVAPAATASPCMLVVRPITEKLGFAHVVRWKHSWGKVKLNDWTECDILSQLSSARSFHPRCYDVDDIRSFSINDLEFSTASCPHIPSLFVQSLKQCEEATMRRSQSSRKHAGYPAMGLKSYLAYLAQEEKIISMQKNKQPFGRSPLIGPIPTSRFNFTTAASSASTSILGSSNHINTNSIEEHPTPKVATASAEVKEKIDPIAQLVLDYNEVLETASVSSKRFVDFTIPHALKCLQDGGCSASQAATQICECLQRLFIAPKDLIRGKIGEAGKNVNRTSTAKRVRESEMQLLIRMEHKRLRCLANGLPPSDMNKKQKKEAVQVISAVAASGTANLKKILQKILVPTYGDTMMKTIQVIAKLYAIKLTHDDDDSSSNSDTSAPRVNNPRQGSPFIVTSPPAIIPGGGLLLSSSPIRNSPAFLAAAAAARDSPREPGARSLKRSNSGLRQVALRKGPSKREK